MQEEEDVTLSQSHLYDHHFEMKPNDICQEPKTVPERVDEEVWYGCGIILPSHLSKIVCIFNILDQAVSSALSICQEHSSSLRMIHKKFVNTPLIAHAIRQILCIQIFTPQASISVERLFSSVGRVSVKRGISPEVMAKAMFRRENRSVIYPALLHSPTEFIL